MLKGNCRRFMADFETTVYEGQEDTYVWASAITELFDKTDHVEIGGSIEDAYAYLLSFNEDMIVYYHNVKFDGSFWLSFLIDKLGYKQAFYYIPTKDGKESIEWLKDKDMPNQSVKYSISSRGQWYTITIKTPFGRIIELRDSLKLIPFSVEEVGQSFGVSRQKLDMDYEGYRYPGCEITAKEKEYIKNDVLVMKEALESLIENGNDKLTIGSCCMYEFKHLHGKEEFKKDFPDLSKQAAPGFTDCFDIDTYIRKSYFGGWCYSVPEKRNKLYHNGVTLDVTSLYPSVMHSISGNLYPYGKPMFWRGNEIPKKALARNTIYFIRVKTRFYLKPGKLPIIQIKGNLLYPSREHLKSSDVYNPIKKAYLRDYLDDGKMVPAIPTLTLTQMDWELIQEHYDLEDTEILDGCFFYARSGIFDAYIDKYAAQKAKSKGAKRTEAKLFLNNLYGKFGANTNSSFKMIYFDEEGGSHFTTIEQYNKTPGYIPIGSCVTSYARCFTIRAAQANYKYFAYADTDSIHCHCSVKQIKGCVIHPNALLTWKVESEWDTALFVRQKTYIEIEKGNIDIKCAGLPAKSKLLFRYVVGDKTLTMIEEGENRYLLDEHTGRKTKLRLEDLEFLDQTMDLSDFKVGIKIPGKLKQKRIKGGVLLSEGIYEMRKSPW